MAIKGTPSNKRYIVVCITETEFQSFEKRAATDSLSVSEWVTRHVVAIADVCRRSDLING